MQGPEFPSSQDNQSIVLPPTTLFRRYQESSEAKKSARGVGNLQLGYQGKMGARREASGFPSMTVGWG